MKKPQNPISSFPPSATIVPPSISFEPGVEVITHYFNNLSPQQHRQFYQLGNLYATWNQRLNLISRQDLPNLYIRHVLHALSIAKFIAFKANTRMLDVGTGGGFPGIPLAILFPDSSFHLVDSIAKKINAVQAIVEALQLTNVTTQVTRAETLLHKYDFVLGRAVTQLDTFCSWVRNKIATQSHHALPNGILYLKGDAPLSLTLPHHIYPLADVIDHPFFENKQLIHIY
jgi:16S rRNA (guanine527-N7)-methyltransferase